MEQTLVIVKPDAVARGLVGEIILRLEAARLVIRALRMVQLDQAGAEGFYQVHRGRPFFESLTRFMASGPCIPMVLEGEGAIATVRQLMGATDPAKAAPGTIRHDLATSIEQNVIHGSDSPETAAFEIRYFFSALDLVPPSRRG